MILFVTHNAFKWSITKNDTRTLSQYFSVCKCSSWPSSGLVGSIFGDVVVYMYIIHVAVFNSDLEPN